MIKTIQKSWAVYLLAKHPDVQQRVQREVDQVWDGETAAVDRYEKLPFTTMVFNEAMRLFPPVYTASRQAVEPVKIGNYWLPAGAQVHLVPFITHRDARWFPKPEEFCPDRFASGTKAEIPRFAFMPFGAGPRACLGGGLALTKGVLILATLMRHCRLGLTASQGAPELEPLISLHPKGSIQLQLSHRHDR